MTIWIDINACDRIEGRVCHAAAQKVPVPEETFIRVVARHGINKDVGYISTGGGAFLQVLEGKKPPAFEILARRAAA